MSRTVGCCCMVPVIVNYAPMTDEFYETRRRRVCVLLLPLFRPCAAYCYCSANSWQAFRQLKYCYSCVCVGAFLCLGHLADQQGNKWWSVVQALRKMPVGCCKNDFYRVTLCTVLSAYAPLQSGVLSKRLNVSLCKQRSMDSWMEAWFSVAKDLDK